MKGTSTHLDIGGRRVGPGEPVYIVAEMSANHSGDYGQAVAIMKAAKDAGADAVKIQTYTPDTMTIPHHGEGFIIGKGTLWEGRNLYDLYKEAFTPWEWHKGLRDEAARMGIGFFSTAFDETAVDFLEDLQVPVHKVASFEIVDLPLIRRMAATGKPLIMSTGMSAEAEIREAVDTARATGAGSILLLKCTSAYPAPPSEMNLRTIPSLAAAFGVPAGLSDHTLGHNVAVAAVALGACMVEKHFTLSRGLAGPDSAFSMEPAEFAEMVRGIRIAEAALGTVKFGSGNAEESSKVFRRSLYVVRDIKAGEAFDIRSVRAIRPGFGMHTRHLEEILGRKAARDLARGTALDWSMVAPQVMKAGDFWDLPEAEEEAGQDKLRTAVEWGAFQRFRKSDGKQGALLNLKPGLGDGFFARDGRVPPVTVFPGSSDPEAWLKSIPSEAFDEIFGLDFFQLHPDIEKGIGELSRVLKRDGILFLNFFSREHFRLADSLSSPDGETRLREVSAVPANILSPEQVAEVSRRHGLAVRKIIPYSSFYGNSLWVDLMKSRFCWDWFLDLLSSDRKLFHLALFLEEGIVAKLGSVAAPRFILVLEKTDGQAGGSPSLEGEESARKALSSPISPSVLADWMGVPMVQLRGILDAHLSGIRNRIFFHHLWTLIRVNIPDGDGLDWSAFLPDRTRDDFLRWEAQERLDSQCLEAARGWHGIPAVARKVRHRGIPLGPGLEYEQVHAILRDVFGLFRKGQSR